jgi:RHS repeat-associated protein
MRLETGATAGNYYYTRDQLGSIRELTDTASNLRARYQYDPFGAARLIAGDVTADFGFATMFQTPEANLNLTRFRAYDPGTARWLSRDPLKNAELAEGINMYIYAHNDPANRVDLLGLQCEKEGIDVDTYATLTEVSCLIGAGGLVAGVFFPPLLSVGLGGAAACIYFNIQLQGYDRKLDFCIDDFHHGHHCTKR